MQELIGEEISSLFKQFPLERVVEGKAYKDLIKAKRKPELAVTFELHYISQKKNLAFLKITESDSGGEKQKTIAKLPKAFQNRFLLAIFFRKTQLSSV